MMLQWTRGGWNSFAAIARGREDVIERRVRMVTCVVAPRAPRVMTRGRGHETTRERARARAMRPGTRDARATTRATTRRRAADEREREIDDATRKWGLEVGLWKVWTSGKDARGDGAEGGDAGASRMDMAKKLLKRYGSAYLATSISLSLISITVFYFLVAGGIDVAALLEKIGITVNATSEQFGTFALAYAAHKASSPIRFGPTVALTPLVARWMGKDVDVVEEAPPTDDK